MSCRALRVLTFVAPLLLLAASGARAAPIDHVRIHGIALSDGPDGPLGRGQRASTVTAAGLSTMVGQLNQIFAGTGIQLEFDAATDFETMEDTALNQLDWGFGVDFYSRGNAVAARYPNKMVIFFRWGNTGTAGPSGWAFAFPPATGARVPASAPLPTEDVHFIAYMNNLSFPAVGLAHEIGHYLGLYHTFQGWNDGATSTRSSATRAVTDAGGIEGLDGDGLADTPADAGRQFYLNAVDSANLCSGLGYSFRVVIDHDDRGHPIFATFSTTPDNKNAMGYFYCSPAHFSAQQATLMRNTLRSRYRSALLTPDLVVWRPGNGTWFARPMQSWVPHFIRQWGTRGDVPVPGDYDKDGTPDIAVWRPDSGYWLVLSSANPNVPIVRQWGASGDIPVPGDYDGDGQTDFAVWRPGDGTWHVIQSRTGSTTATQWGTAGDVPVARDFDGDGRTDVAVWRPSDGTWYIIPTRGPLRFQSWGIAGDIPVARDFDGDGQADIAVWRPSDGVWYIICSTNGQVLTRQWGTSGDVPVPADFDGDGKTDVAVWRPSEGNWYIVPSRNPWAPMVHQWGTWGDIPLTLR